MNNLFKKILILNLLMVISYTYSIEQVIDQGCFESAFERNEIVAQAAFLLKDFYDAPAGIAPEAIMSEREFDGDLKSDLSIPTPPAWAIEHAVADPRRVTRSMSKNGASSKSETKTQGVKRCRPAKSYEEKLVLHYNCRILRLFSQLTRETVERKARELCVDSNDLKRYRAYLLHSGKRLPKRFEITSQHVKKFTPIETLQ